MSDSTPLWRALNGLAAWFNAGGGILQSGAWLGALICLAMVVYGVAIKRPTVSVGVVGTWFIFMSSMGMTGTAQVVNVYTGAITTVANVPALALIPASIFSSASYKVFTSMETAFQSTTGSYMSVSTNGFVGPLDLLLTLRSNNFPAAHPALQRTLVQVVADCGVDPLSTAVPAVTMRESLDVLDWLKTYGRQTGITTTYSETDVSGVGTVVSCVGALNYLDTKYNALASGNSEMVKFINENAGKSNPIGANGNWGNTAINDSYTTLMGGIVGVSQDAIKFTKNALVSSAVAGTIDCMGNSGLMTSPDTCATSALTVAEGREAWKTNAAMNGSGFVKIMFTSMGFLQVLFFALFPFIALYGLIVVNKTVVVFGSYILFGIWSQSWLLVVAPIQSYIQNSVIDELTRVVGSSGGMTMANQAAIYGVLSDKLAVASDMMANSQMLALALLSGSIYSLSSLVGQSGGSQHMDGSTVQKKMTNSSPMVESGATAKLSSMVKNNDGSGIAVLRGTGSTELTGSVNDTGTSSTSSGIQEAREVAKRQETAQSYMRSELAKEGYSIEESKKIAKQLTDGMGYTATLNSNMISGGLKALKGFAQANNKPFGPKEEAAATKLLEGSNQKAINTLTANDKSFWGRFTSDNATERQGAMIQAAEMGIDIASGVTTAAALATIPLTGGLDAVPAIAAAGAIQAGKSGMKVAAKQGIKNLLKEEALDTAVGAAGNAGRAALRGATSRFGEAVSGGVGAIGQAAHNNVISTTDATGATRGFGRDSSASGTLAANLTNVAGDSFKRDYSQSASKSTIKSTSTSVDLVSATNRMATGGATAIADAKANEAMLRQSSKPDDVKRADQRVNELLGVKGAPGGTSFSSSDPSVSSSQLDAGVRAQLFTEFIRNDNDTKLGDASDMANTGLQSTPVPVETSGGGNAPKPAPSGPFKKQGGLASQKRNYLTDSAAGNAPKLEPVKTISQKLDDTVSTLTSVFTSTGKSAAAMVNPNMAPASTFIATAPKSSGKPTGSSGSSTEESPTTTSGLAFANDPSARNAAMPSAITMTDGSAQTFVNNNGKQRKFADGASNRFENNVLKSNTTSEQLDNYKPGAAMRRDAEEQSGLVDKLVVGAVAAQTAGTVVQLIGDAMDSRNQRPAPSAPSGSSSPSTQSPSPAETNEKNRARTSEKAEKFRARRR